MSATALLPMPGPIVILIGGGHAAGKHTAEALLRQELERRHVTDVHQVCTLDMESFADSTSLKPSRYDYAALGRHIDALPSNTIAIVIGLYALYDRAVRDRAHMKVFIDSDPDTRLIRWIRRETAHDRDSSAMQSHLELVLGTYLGNAKGEMTNYIFPTKEFADVIMPRGAETQSVSLVVDGLQALLNFKLPAFTTNVLRPSRLSKEKFDIEKGKFYELN